MPEVAAGTGSSPGAAAPPAAPSITFGGGAPAAPPPAPSTPAPDATATTPETPDFEFSFEGDTEKYRYQEDKPTEETPVYDASKPFDPQIEERLKDTPELLKGLKQGHYELRQWKGQGFKNPAELKAYRDRIEALGGADTIEKDATETNSRIAQLHSGDEAAIQWLAKEHPEGFTKLAGAYLKQLQANAPGIWAREMASVMMATLKQPNAQGMSPLAAFNQLYDLDGIKDNPAAQKLLSQIAETLNAVAKAAASSPAEGGTGGGAHTEEAQKLSMERHTIYLQKVNLQADPIINSAAQQAIKAAFKGLKLSAESQTEILKDIKTEFNRLQKQDETFQANARDLLRKNDTERFIRVLKAAIARNMPRAALREARKFKGLSGDQATRRAEGQARTETPAGGSPQAQRVRYSGPMKQGGPDPSLIDYAEMRARFGRKGTDEMLGRREFLKKGDSKTTFFW